MPGSFAVLADDLSSAHTFSQKLASTKGTTTMSTVENQILSGNESLTDKPVMSLEEMYGLLGLIKEQAFLSLKNFAAADDFSLKMASIFGEGNDYSTWQTAFASGTFTNFPTIEILPGSTLTGANAAYAGSTNTIYFSQDFLTQYASNSQAIISVLIEEFGHSVDWQVNAEIDTPGDEGELFSAIVHWANLSEAQIQQIELESDIKKTVINGQIIQAEASNPPIDMRSAINGLSNLFSTLQSSIDNEIWANSLPLLGNTLYGSSSVSFIDSLGDKIVEKLKSYSSLTASTVFEALNEIGEQVEYLENNYDSVKFRVTFNGSQSFSTPIGSDLGLPGLNFEIDGEAEAKLAYSFITQFGVTRDGEFFLDSSLKDEFTIDLDATLPGLQATGKLGFLQLDVTDDTGKSILNNILTIDLNDFNRNGRIEFSDVSAKLTSNLSLDLGLKTSFEGSNLFPSITSDFLLDWLFLNAEISSSSNNIDWGTNKPTVLFDNILLNGGEVFSNFATPFLQNIQYATQFLGPFTQALTYEIDLFTQLKEERGIDLFDFNQDGRTNLIDLMKVFAGDKLDLSLLSALADFNNLANDYLSKFKQNEQNELVLDFGSFTLGDADIRDSNLVLKDVVPKVEKEPFNLEKVFIDDNNFTPDGYGINRGSFSTDMKNYLQGFKNLDLEFPILSNPLSVFGLFLGTPTDLITFDLPDLNLDFGVERYFPLAVLPFGTVGVTFKGDISAKSDLEFGFDTYGLQSFLETKNAFQLFNGFYAADKAPELKFDADIRAFGALDAGVARGGVGGGIYADLWMNLVDSISDGKVRLLDLSFDVGGSINTGLESYAEVGFPDKEWLGQRLGERWTWESPKQQIFAFDTSITPKDYYPKLATVLNNGVLQLNMGTNADQRVNPNSVTDGYEDFRVEGQSQVTELASFGNLLRTLSLFEEANSYPLSSSVVNISAFGFTETYAGFNKIFADGGTGNTVLELINTYIPLEFWGGEGDDSIRGGSGNDVIYGAMGWDRIFGGDGSDEIFGGDDDDILYGGNDDDVIDGGNGNDIINGDNGDDIINGNDGSDNLSGNNGNDYIQGGNGDDVIDGGNGNDSLSGGLGNDFIFGDSGSDLIHGDDGNDTLSGDDGADTLYGGTGDDNLHGGDGNDSLYGEDGNDNLYGGNGDDYMVGGPGMDFFDGGNGEDLISFKDAPSAIAFSLKAGGWLGEAFGDRAINVENLEGSLFDDYLIGDDLSNKIYGLAGNDTIEGYDGDDWLYGGLGNDILRGGQGADTLYGDEGDDYLDGGLGDDTLYGGIGNNRLDAGEGNNIITAGDGNNLVYAGPGNDTIALGNGNNQIYAGEGQNVITVGRGDNRIYGGASADIITVGDGNNQIYAAEGNNVITVTGSGVNTIDTGHGDDIIYGGAGNDRIVTRGGNDTIYAAEGNNYIDAGDGVNTIFSGSGADIFVLGWGSQNTIMQFDIGKDKLGLSQGLQFGQLDISQGSKDGQFFTEIKLAWANTPLATLNWTQAADIDSSSFINV